MGLRMIEKAVSFLELIYKAAVSDVMVLLPMNASKIRVLKWVRRISRAKIIADIYIPAYSNALDYSEQHAWTARELAEQMDIDRSLLSVPDLVVHMNRAEVTQMEGYTGIVVPADRLEIIPPTSLSFPEAEPSSSEVFRIAWWGSFAPLHGLDLVLDAAEELKREGFRFALNLYGSPVKAFESIDANILRRDLGDSVFLRTDLSFGDRSLVEVLRTTADLALGHFGTAAKSEVVITNKLIEALAFGLPILSKSTAVLAEFLSPDDDLFTCAGTAAAIKQEIRSIAENPLERRRRAANGLARWHAIFSLNAFERATVAAMTSV